MTPAALALQLASAIAEGALVPLETPPTVGAEEEVRIREALLVAMEAAGGGDGCVVVEGVDVVGGVVTARVTGPAWLLEGVATR